MKWTKLMTVILFSTVIVRFGLAITQNGTSSSTEREQAQGRRTATRVRDEVYYVTRSWSPRDIGEMAAKSQLVVEGNVESVFPSVETGESKLLTDAVVNVVSLFKGSLPRTQLVVSQSGGTTDKFSSIEAGVTLLKAGEHYIFFLNEVSADSSRRVPERAGLPKYQIVGDILGALRIEGNQLRLPKAMSPEFRASYEGANPDQVKAEVEIYVGRTQGQ